MTEQDLQKVHNDLYDLYITDPENLEKEINAIASIAAKQALLNNGTITFQFQDNTFVARLTEDIKGFLRVIRLVVSNEESRKIAGNRYIPYTIEAEINNDMSAFENYCTVFEAFLRHICGAIRPEVLE